MAAQLLATKLYTPPLRPELVPRPRLIELLDRGLNAGHKLTLISAPAGYGKTTLVADWLRRAQRPSAWLSLDQGDNDLVRFFAHLIAAMQTVDPDIGQADPAMLETAQPPAPEPLTTSLINDIAKTPRPFVLVLDDYHVIRAAEIHDALDFMLDHFPHPLRGMHLVIATRADPPLPIPLLRSRGQLNELYQTDLRFTSEEIAQFLELVLGFRLPAQEVTALEERTEGWIAGLQMAAISLRGRDDVAAFVQAFTGSHRYILDYLSEEVLHQQSPDVRLFLLKTAILDRLCSELCDAVIGVDAQPPERFGVESQSVLEYLERNNLFVIPLDDGRRWYRYHHLFADLLRHRLRREQPNLEPELHLQASRWYEQNELLSEAVSHALAAGNDERVARLVEGRSLAMMERGVSAALLQWLSILPDTVKRTRPWLCVARAWVLVCAGKLNAIEVPLQDAEDAVANIQESVQQKRIVGHIAAIRMFAVFLEGNPDLAVELGRQALHQLPESEVRVRGFVASHLASALRWRGDLAAAAKASADVVTLSQPVGENQVTAEALCILAGTQILQGRLHDAATSCREAIRLADDYLRQTGRCLPVTGLAYARLSLILLEWGDVDAAVRYARQGAEISAQWGTADILLVCYRELAHALQARGEPDNALEAVTRGMRWASGMSEWVAADMAAERARLWLSQGNLAAARDWAENSGLTASDKVPFHREKEYRIFARVLIADGKAAQALRLLAPLVDMLEALRAKNSLISARVLQALALQDWGDTEQAVSALTHALSLAEPEGYLRTFVDEGEPMSKLLRRAHSMDTVPDYVNRLLVALKGVPQPAPTEAQPLVEPLTERELEVLRLIAAGLSNQEIAEELVIAVSTVKSHINHIYGKLEVRNRTQALAKAQSLALL